jgi:hypothetical protein
MRRSGIGSDGGIGMNKQVNSRAPKAEPRAHAVNPGGVSQLGNKVGSHVTNQGDTGYRGENLIGKRGYEPPGMISDPVKAVGVGGGRTVMKSGQQAQHGPVAGTPRPQGRDILGAFGPEWSRE